jgi:hypothetical protein
VSAVYLVALLGVSIAILWLLVDAVISVSRKPRWEMFSARSFTLVKSEDRRARSMPFVGTERRKVPGDTGYDEGGRLAA